MGCKICRFYCCKLAGHEILILDKEATYSAKNVSPSNISACTVVTHIATLAGVIITIGHQLKSAQN